MQTSFFVVVAVGVVLMIAIIPEYGRREGRDRKFHLACAMIVCAGLGLVTGLAAAFQAGPD